MAKFVKGQVPWNKGIPHSEKSNEKNRQAHLGKKHKPEVEALVTKNLLVHGEKTRFVKGMKPWNAGLKYGKLTEEEKKVNQKAWREANKEKIYQNGLAWKKANPDKVAITAKKSRQKHMPRVIASVNKRRADKLQRTPKWLTKDDLWLIKEAYELAALRTKHFGFKWHVDHIIPLKGKTVSGLHVPNNLQVIEGILNIMKNNKFEGDMPCPLS
jgi:hypothetical protein